MMKQRRTTPLYKMYPSFLFFRKGLKLLLCVRQTDGMRQDGLLYWPIKSSHSTLCYRQDPLSTSSASQPGLLNRRPHCLQQLPAVRSHYRLHCLQLSTEGHPTGDSRPQRGAFTNCNWLWLRPSLSPTLNCRGHQHILFHNAHLLPLRSPDIFPLIYTGESLIDGSVKGQ